VLKLPKREVVEQVVAAVRIEFPYVPGLLSFREGPAALAAIAKLSVEPDVFLFDGQGFAHPRRFGLACHLGLWLDRPTLGCAKSLLCGTHRRPGLRRGSAAAIKDHGETIGLALRTRDGVAPVFVSAGHRMDLKTARRIVLRCGGGVRIPEPTHRAHILVNQEVGRT
jgi:deoxyribonuclease V